MSATAEAVANGMLAALFVIAAAFFLKFWRESRDFFFLAFSAAFLIKGANTVTVAFMDKPNQASPWNYAVGLCSSILILAAIAYKNLKDR